MNYKSLLCFTVLVLAAACARDRDQDDYKREEFEKQLAEMKVVEGAYVGQLVRLSSGAELGAVSIDLSAVERASGDVATKKAVLMGKLVYRGNNLIKLVFKESSFDPDKLSFSSTITQNGRELDIEGQIVNGQLVGSLGIFGFEDEAASFKLSRIGSQFTTAESVVIQNPKPTGSLEDIERTYSGIGVNGAGQQESVVLRVSNLHIASIEDRFLDFLSPRKNLNLNIEFDASVDSTKKSNTSFKNAIWDSANNQLTASEQKDGGVTISLNCLGSSAASTILACLYQSSERGVRIQMTLTQQEAR